MPVPHHGATASCTVGSWMGLVYSPLTSLPFPPMAPCPCSSAVCRRRHCRFEGRRLLPCCSPSPFPFSPLLLNCTAFTRRFCLRAPAVFPARVSLSHLRCLSPLTPYLLYVLLKWRRCCLFSAGYLRHSAGAVVWRRRPLDVQAAVTSWFSCLVVPSCVLCSFLLPVLPTQTCISFLYLPSCHAALDRCWLHPTTPVRLPSCLSAPYPGWVFVDYLGLTRAGRGSPVTRTCVRLQTAPTAGTSPGRVLARGRFTYALPYAFAIPSFCPSHLVVQVSGTVEKTEERRKEEEERKKRRRKKSGRRDLLIAPAAIYYTPRALLFTLRRVTLPACCLLCYGRNCRTVAILYCTDVLRRTRYGTLTFSGRVFRCGRRLSFCRDGLRGTEPALRPFLSAGIGFNTLAVYSKRTSATPDATRPTGSVLSPTYPSGGSCHFPCWRDNDTGRDAFSFYPGIPTERTGSRSVAVVPRAARTVGILRYHNACDIYLCYAGGIWCGTLWACVLDGGVSPLTLFYPSLCLRHRRHLHFMPVAVTMRLLILPLPRPFSHASAARRVSASCVPFPDHKPRPITA